MEKFLITICMATYNGAEFLPTQLDSLLSQTMYNWRLLVRDDGSTDQTLSILKRYMEKYGDKISLVSEPIEHLGPSQSFGCLLERADTDYIMFCDQDDKWKPEKIEMTLAAMKETEEQYPGRPILVHTDMEVVDADLNTIAESFWNYQKIFPERGGYLKNIMAQNIVTGCAMMINRKARTVSLPIPNEAIMHDWWIAMSVAKTGQIIRVPTTSILYRQHRHNEKGAHRAGLFQFLRKIYMLTGLMRTHYKMLRRFDPEVNYGSILIRKSVIKIAQICS